LDSVPVDSGAILAKARAKEGEDVQPARRGNLRMKGPVVDAVVTRVSAGGDPSA
jgi:hypothetical protein